MALLALEGTETNALSAALAVYEKLFTCYSDLLGVTGFRALMSRSAHAASARNPFLAPLATQGDIPQGSQLRACLQGRSDLAISAGATVLYASFLGLLGTFIGDDLTIRALRGSWPGISEAALSGKNKRQV